MRAAAIRLNSIDSNGYICRGMRGLCSAAEAGGPLLGHNEDRERGELSGLSLNAYTYE